MPSIHLFQRKTLLGGDDLQPSSIFILGCRLVQLILLIGPIWFHIGQASKRHGGILNFMFYDPNDSGYCRHCHLFPLLLVCYTSASTLITCIVGIVLQQRIYHWSSVGTPTDPQPRSKHVEQLLEFKLVPFQILQALVFLLGTSSISFAKQFHNCLDMEDTKDDDFLSDDYDPRFWYQTSGKGNHDDIQYLVSKHAWWVAFAILLLSQMIEVLSSCIYVSTLMSRPHQNILRYHSSSTLHQSLGNNGELDEDDNAAYFDHHDELAEEMWKERCTNFCQFLSKGTCYLFGGKDIALGEFSDVARALTDYLETGGVLDLVPSDLVMGFIMLQRIQRKRTLEARQQVQDESVRIHSDGPDSIHYGSSSASNSNSMLQAVCEDDGDDDSSNTPRPSSQHSAQANESLLVPLETSTSTSSLGDVDTEVALNDNTTGQFLPSFSWNVEKEKSRRTELEFQMKRTASLSIFYVPQRRKVLSRHDPYDLQTLQEGARFLRYALAIYTWPLYVYGNPMTGIPRLICKNTCCQKRSPRTQASSTAAASENGLNSNNVHEDYNENSNMQSSSSATARGPFSNECDPLVDHEHGVLGDNCCQTHKSAMLLQTGLTEADIVYAQLQSSFTQIPYCIVLDHEWNTVVLSIRGTFSLEDCITDVTIDPEPLDDLGNEFGFNGDGEHCHGGILSCARIVHRDLESHGILNRLLLGEHAKYRNYKLRIVGHSLGGGIAILLSFMMRQKNPDLRCVTHSPPGCSMSWGLATACQEFTTTFILDSDIVPRLSYDTMENFRNEVLELIGRVKVSKMEATSKAVSVLRWYRICQKIDSEEDREHLTRTISELLYEPADVPDSAYLEQLEQFKTIQQERRERRGSLRSIKMFPPGKIVHLVKTGENRTCCHGLAKCVTCCTSNAGSEYTPVWAGNDDFNEITVSPTMGTDHFPTRLCPEIEGIASAYGVDINSPSTERGMERV